ncbi:hypothetical protein [Nonomuraea rubra]|uniref:hypothetical protein n=1 Tax=Nonomuraea rubra TaxID=46180 RepID=UPI0031EEA7F6
MPDQRAASQELAIRSGGVDACSAVGSPLERRGQVAAWRMRSATAAGWEMWTA